MNIFALIIGLVSLAGQPPHFSYQDSKAVFVDFKKAEYTLELNVTDQIATGTSKILLDQDEAGRIIFDLRSDIEEIRIDGEVTNVTRISDPDKSTKFLVVNKLTSAGSHELEVRHRIQRDIGFSGGAASAAFWLSDLEDGGYLERYFPTNLEYDQYRMELLVKLIGHSSPVKIFTNGDVLSGNAGEYVITFADHYNCAGPFFHMGPATNFSELTEVFVTAKSHKIPITIYGKKGSNLQRYLDISKKTINELEADYGGFPHEKLLVYGTESFPGGMEYQGATITNAWALAHEITHSYFGRGLMPANGDAGWLDEALASWRDDGYQRIGKLHQDFNHMAKRSPYTRYTPQSAYTQGAELMGHFDARIAARGDSRGLKTFLNKMLEEKVFKPWTTEEFQSSLQEFTGEDLSPLFDPLVYGKRAAKQDLPVKNSFKSAKEVSSKYHGHLTDKIRKEIL